MQMESDSYVRVAAEDLKRTVAKLLEKSGALPSHADIASDVLVTADLRGIESHGVGRLLPYYISRLQKGFMNPRPDYSVVQSFGATFVLDGDNGLGHPACHLAMQRCIELAKKFGVAMGGIRNSNHFGIAAYYSMMALKDNMVGICLSNSMPLVIPTFSKERLLGTNPISIAVPAGKTRPFVLDMATSVAPIGKVQVGRRKGVQVPPQWGADHRGRATSDPAQILEGGGLFPLGGPAETGGYKGYGLAAAVDIFSGVLTGAGFLSSVLSAQSSPDPCQIGHFVMAIQVEAFMDIELFKERMDSFVRELQTAPLAEGSEKIFVAGEKEFLQWEVNMERGVPVHKKVWEELTAMAMDLGIRLPATYPADF